MAFDPLEWITVAESLASQGGEAPHRAAIGRYYYAVFLKCRLSLTHDGRMTPTGEAKDHRAVATTLKQNKRGNAGIALDNLYRLRAQSDYEPGQPVTSATVEAAKAFAGEVVRLCEADWARLPP